MDNFVANINLGKKLGAASHRKRVKKVARYLRREAARLAKAKESEIKIDRKLNEFLIKNVSKIRHVKVAIKRSGEFVTVSAEVGKNAKAGDLQQKPKADASAKQVAQPAQK
ncbi:MAG: hypothetical protein QW774_01420 [Candidatus Micrarchaeaceae archaeon]